MSIKLCHIEYIGKEEKNYEHGIFSCSTGTSALKNKSSLMNFIETGLLPNFNQIDHDRPG